MLKFLGSLFIVSSMTGIGIWKAEEVKHSYQALGKNISFDWNDEK